VRKFSSYGPVNNKMNYYAPRNELVERAYTQLIGEQPSVIGHYITVWAPRQCGKTWVMQQVLQRIQKEPDFDVLKINLENLKDQKEPENILAVISRKIGEGLNKKFSKIHTQDAFQEIFKRGNLNKPLVLIFDEFDALSEEGINAVVSAFRNIYMSRMDEIEKSYGEKSYLLHAVALIGVRSVLGIENTKGSPFNIQRSIHIPNLMFDEVNEMFLDYERETGQQVLPEAIQRLYNETQGQPGLTCWFGELLTETYNEKKDSGKPLTSDDFEEVLPAAIKVLPNNNIINIISTAREEEYKSLVLELFNTDKKMEFTYDDPKLNYLYMNGVIDFEKELRDWYYVKFSSPFVQKRLFNYFSKTLFLQMTHLVEPFIDIDAIITPTQLNIHQLMKLYQTYLEKNKDWMFQDAPRRTDLRIYEAVYHFNIYTYINEFLKNKKGMVYPEFPTGNGKIDLLIYYHNKTYGIELKSFTDLSGYRDALEQAALYGKNLEMEQIYLVFFIEKIDEKNKKTYEADYLHQETQVTVHPIFIQTGN
jgi:hypothetical protein